MRLSRPVAVGLCLMAPALPSFAETTGTLWKVDPMEGGTRLSACAGIESADCVVFRCPEGGQVQMEVQVPLVSPLGSATALMGVDGAMTVAQSFAADAETGTLTATFTAPDPGALVQAMATGSALTLRLSDARLAALDSLTALALTGAAEAVPEFLSSCPQLAAPVAADAASAPAEDAVAEAAVEDVPEDTTEAAPSDTAGTQPSAAASAAPPAAAPAFVKGMPLTFAPDPAAGPATPDDAPGRFVTVKDASLDSVTPATLAQALMTAQQIDFAARFGGAPVISGDMAIFTDGRLLVTVLFCVAGKTGDEGCETWTMATIGGGAPFAMSTKGLPSDRPLWIDLAGPGKDGWPDVMAQDASGAWTRYTWSGAGYF